MTHIEWFMGNYLLKNYEIYSKNNHISFFFKKLFFIMYLSRQFHQC